MSAPHQSYARRSSSGRLRRPIAIDLFAGAGGLSLGFEQAGFDIVASVDYDPVHAAVHEFNFPRTYTICGDMRSLTADSILAGARQGLLQHGRDADELSYGIDVIIGGPPCQGFSLIGHRALDDPRNALVFRFLDIITELQPRYFVMENVPGMLSGGHSSILSDLVARFEKTAGYRVSQPVRILNAADFGVPQDRRRLFVLGSRPGEDCPLYPAPTVAASSVKRRMQNSAPVLLDVMPKGPTVDDALRDLPDLDDFSELLRSDEVSLSKSLLSRMESRASQYARRLREMTPDPEDYSYSRVWDPTLLTSSLRTVHTKESIRRFKATPQGTTEPTSRFLRLDPNGLCNTLRAGSGSERGAFTSPRPIHPHRSRVLSVREAARLHGFPDWFRFHVTKWHGFRSIGNSVPPPLARAVGQRIAASLGWRPSKPRRRLELGSPDLLTLNRLEAAAYFQSKLEDIPRPRKRDAESA